MPTSCHVCGRPTIDHERGVHAACRPAPEGVPTFSVPAREEAKAHRSVVPPVPRVLEPAHEVESEALPRGPKTVAAKIGDAWEHRWERAVTEELKDPKRGGESYGLVFRHRDGRHGWAIWIAGSFVGAFLWPHPYALVPKKLSASELKKVVSDE